MIFTSHVCVCVCVDCAWGQRGCEQRSQGIDAAVPRDVRRRLLRAAALPQHTHAHTHTHTRRPRRPRTHHALHSPRPNGKHRQPEGAYTSPVRVNVCVDMFVCVCVCICVCGYVYITRVCVYVCVCACVCVCGYVCITRVSVCVCVCGYVTWPSHSVCSGCTRSALCRATGATLRR